MGDRRMPSLNPILTRIALAKNKAVCKRRLRSVKASVDTRCPKSLEKGRKRNRKKEQMDEDRFSHIERENRILLTRMSQIMLRSNTTTKGDRSHVQSLNLPHRKREVKRINATNRLILDRIEKTRPYYDHKKWNRERKKIEHTLKTMGNYPYVLGLSKQKRRKAIGAVIKRRSKHRNPAVLNIRRPATSAARMTGHKTGKTKKRGKNKKGGSMTRARSAAELAPLDPLRTPVRATRLQARRPQTSNNSLYEPTTSGSIPLLQNEMGALSLDDHHASEQSETEALFHLLDRNNDGLVSRTELEVGLEDPTVQQFLSNSSNTSPLAALRDNTSAGLDAFDSLKTSNVDGAANVEEFNDFLTTYTL